MRFRKPCNESTFLNISSLYHVQLVFGDGTLNVSVPNVSPSVPSSIPSSFAANDVLHEKRRHSTCLLCRIILYLETALRNASAVCTVFVPRPSTCGRNSKVLPSIAIMVIVVWPNSEGKDNSVCTGGAGRGAAGPRLRGIRAAAVVALARSRPAVPTIT